jgi:4-amino-4-deoxy-L-arabinose transferase-like glycosyltransferase
MTKIPPIYGNHIFRIAAAMIVISIYFFGLTVPLLGPDEPRYSQVAREMFERGDWITPTLGGFHWFEKPVLLYWLQIVSYNIFGVSEFSARFGSALFGLATVAALWLLGRAYARFSKVDVNDLAFWLALVSASSLGLIAFARGASFDIVLTFPMTAAMVSFFVSELRERASEGSDNLNVPPVLPLFLFYVFIGISLLAKGLVGIVFPFAIAAFYYLLSWRFPSRRMLLSIVWGTVIALFVAASWYVPMYLRHGWVFIDEFFVQHHFQRYTSNKYLHPQPFYFFFWVLPLMTLPWLPFFLAAVWRFGKQLVRVNGPDLEELTNENPSSTPQGAFRFGSLIRFSFAWMLVPLVFFSFSGSKLPGYILPSLPPALILTTLYVMSFVRKKPSRGRAIVAIAGTTFAVVIVILVTSLPKFADTDSVRRLIEMANERGYRDAKVLTFHTVSHNAEYYAPGRLLRDGTGRQRKLVSPVEIRNELDKNGWENVLVLVPLEYSKQLNESTTLSSETIADNGEYLIAKVSRANN